MTTLLLIRHGESEANSKGFFAGQYDVPLIQKGLEQAEKTAEYIVDKYSPDEVYASDLKRAYSTAIPIAKLIDKRIVTKAGLREIYAGKWQKMSFEEIQNKFADDFNVWRNDIGNVRCSGGESTEELGLRVMATLEKIAKENDDKTVVVATHATVIRAALTMIKYGDIRFMKYVPWVTNGSVTVVEYNGGWKTLSVSEDKHLGDNKTEFPANV